MVIHAINNAFSYFSWIVGGEQMKFTWEMIDDRRIYLMLYAVAFVVLVLFYVAVVRRIRRDRSASSARVTVEGAVEESATGAAEKNRQSDQREV